MSSAQKPIQGTVKWFSNKKGYGFITPAEGSPIDTDIFVHQSSISSEGYRTLDEGWVVEFTIGDDGGRAKAENVTGPGGGPCEGPRKHHNRGPRRTRTHIPTNNGRRVPPHYNDRRGPKPVEPHWHVELNEDVKQAMDSKGIRATTGTIDVSFGSARVKLGTGGYSSVAHADGILGEGTFICKADGKATMQWEKCIVFMKEGKWVGIENDSRLVTSLSLLDSEVIAVTPDETAQTLWGDTPTDPREALENNGFKMRRVVLTPRKGR